MPFKRICILRLSALGDVIMTVPMVRALQASFPKAQITWVIDRVAHRLLDGLSGVDFIVIDKPKSLLDYYRFWRLMRQQRFDVLLAMQASLRTNLMYPLINAQRKVGFDGARAKDGHSWFVTETIKAQQNHLLEGFMSFATHIGAKLPKTLKWQLAIAKREQEWLASMLDKPYIVINPAASKAERNWLVLRYVQLIKQIQATYPAYEVVLSGAPNDLDCVAPIIEQTGVRSFVGKTSLKQLTALLEKATLLIAPDTGPVHIASAVNTPVIGLYAVITSKLSGPYLSQSLTVDKYDEALRHCLKKDSTLVAWGTRVHSLDAMALIQVDDVFEKVQGFFKSLQPPN